MTSRSNYRKHNAAGSSLLSVSGRPELFDSMIVFWRGASGHAYAHTAYTLAGCPAPPPCCVILVSRSETGQCTVSAVFAVEQDAPSLNLAKIRKRGAQLSVDEVHLHFASGHVESRCTAVIDLQAHHCRDAIVGVV